jgi:type I restriction enzyme S subunit
VSTVRPNLNSVAVVPEKLDGAIGSTGFSVLRPDPSILDPTYLFHWVQSPIFVDSMVRRATGASYPAVSDSIIRSSSIPLPAISEQRRIAAILDECQHLDQLSRSAQTQLDTLADSIFSDLLNQNPQWHSRGLLEICDARSGGTPLKSRDDYWSGNVPWFSPKDLKQADLADSIDHISETVLSETTLTLFPADTVVFVVRGMILAHTFPVSVLRVPATINQDLKALVPRVPVDPQFLAYAVRHSSSWVLGQTSSSGHGTKRLDSSTLAAIRIPFPSIEIQKRFGATVSVIRAIQALHERRLAASRELVSAIRHRAFGGSHEELVLPGDSGATVRTA